jgi:hypothetical protein
MGRMSGEPPSICGVNFALARSTVAVCGTPLAMSASSACVV